VICVSRLPDGRIAKRVELFRKAVAEALKEIDGAVVENVSDLEKLIRERIGNRVGFCNDAGASAELDGSDIHTATAIVLIFCDELETEVEIPLKLVADTEGIDERHIEVEVSDYW
jgi:hypothetical protein